MRLKEYTFVVYNIIHSNYNGILPLFNFKNHQNSKSQIIFIM